MEQRFYLRGREATKGLIPALVLLVGVTILPVAALLLVTSDLTDPDEVAPAIAVAVSFPTIIIGVLFVHNRAKTAHIAIVPRLLIIRGRNWPNLRIELEAISRIEQHPMSPADGLRALWPLSRATLVNLLQSSPTALRLTLKDGVKYGPFVTVATILIDPEDRRAFVEALRLVAPHVTIDASLVE